MDMFVVLTKDHVHGLLGVAEEHVGASLGGYRSSAVDRC